MSLRTAICLIVVLMTPVFSLHDAGASTDPWQQIRERYKSVPKPVEEKAAPGASDPWQALRAVFLPFSLEEETRARVSRPHATAFSKKFYARLAPYQHIIQEASDTFDIPEAIISAVIMAESAGDPRAAAKSTSAKGLMQTINATFAMARAGLSDMGISIENNPCDPEASIMAGTWYLDRMFDRAVRDGRVLNPDRNSVASWRYPLEYYYAGPGHGAKRQNKIMVFSRGQRRIIDKRAYSEKIQTWAQILNA